MAINRIIAGLFVALVIPQSVYSQGPPQRGVITYSNRSIASIDLFVAQERGSSEVLAKYLNVDFQTALETCRLSRAAFATDGISTDDEINEYLKADAQILGLPAPAPAPRVFDFSLQCEVNRELGVK